MMKRVLQGVTGEKRTKTELLDLLCRWLLAGVFFVAAVPKMMSPGDFAATIGAYGLLPDMLLYPAALVLSYGEFITACGLVLNRRWALPATAAFMLLFIAVLSYGIYLGLDIDCGCFGPDDPEHEAFAGLRVALIRDIILLAPLLYSFQFAFIQTQKNGEKS